MKLAEIVKVIAAREGLKKEVSVGNIREIVGIVSDLHYSEPQGIQHVLWENGKRRSKKNRVRN